MGQDSISVRRAWAEVDLGKLEKNYLSLKSHVGLAVGVVGVVKAEGYGHGAVAVARRLESLGARMLATATVEEAVELRRAGLSTHILVLGGCRPGQEEDVIEHGITPAVYSPQALEGLSLAAGKAGKAVKYHLKVDTGLRRLGIRSEDAVNFLRKASELRGVELEGVFTHFAASDETAHDEFTRSQLTTFRGVLEDVARAGFEVRYRHAANSGGTIFHPRSWLDMVRPGISLYGVNPSLDRETSLIEPILTFKARVLLVKRVAPGETIGYGRTFEASRESVMATLGVGYADGLNRLLSNRGRVIIRGRYAPMVGNVSMDLTTVDVTGVPEVQIGEEAVIVGRDGEAELTAWDMAKLLGTVPYEVLTSIGSRVERVYLG